MVTKKLFGNSNGTPVYCYTISSKELSASLLDYGATLQALVYQGVDVVLGFPDLEGYQKNTGYVGGTIGRVANRIRNANIEIDGKEYALSQNEGRNQLHGGFSGFHQKLFEAKEIENGVELTYLSKDGEEGYPGNLFLTVRFVVEKAKLRIEYSAYADQDTAFAPTAHIYYNLNGEDGDALANRIQINADYYTPVNKELIPLDQDESVAGTPYDFRESKAIVKDAGKIGGYDNNFVLKSNHVLTMVGDKTRIQMDMYSDMPGVQMYSGIQSLNGIQGKRRRYYAGEGIALEPQFAPDAFHSSHHEKPYLKKGETAYHYIELRFSKSQE